MSSQPQKSKATVGVEVPEEALAAAVKQRIDHRYGRSQWESWGLDRRAEITGFVRAEVEQAFRVLGGSLQAIRNEEREKVRVTLRELLKAVEERWHDARYRRRAEDDSGRAQALACVVDDVYAAIKSLPTDAMEEPCETCDGDGCVTVTETGREPDGTPYPYPAQERCPACHGTGKTQPPDSLDRGGEAEGDLSISPADLLEIERRDPGSIARAEEFAAGFEKGAAAEREKQRTTLLGENMIGNFFESKTMAELREKVAAAIDLDLLAPDCTDQPAPKEEESADA